ncbi:hypothetical protein LXL04_017034 [Taraxacum kok-saghyz]
MCTIRTTRKMLTHTDFVWLTNKTRSSPFLSRYFLALIFRSTAALLNPLLPTVIRLNQIALKCSCIIAVYNNVSNSWFDFLFSSVPLIYFCLWKFGSNFYVSIYWCSKRP